MVYSDLFNQLLTGYHCISPHFLWLSEFCSCIPDLCHDWIFSTLESQVRQAGTSHCAEYPQHICCLHLCHIRCHCELVDCWLMTSASPFFIRHPHYLHRSSRYLKYTLLFIQKNFIILFGHAQLLFQDMPFRHSSLLQTKDKY